MDDDLIERIDALVEEEHRLYQGSNAGGGLDDKDEERLRALEVQLDQCWDLLRQRRARRHAGADPELATPREPEVVEHYQQ